MVFSTEQFISSCQSMISKSDAARRIRELLSEHVSDGNAVRLAIGEPGRSGVQKLYVSEDLTIINVVWAPRMTLMPHNHNMWAVIGVYQGREDNIFWRRIENDPDGRIEAAGARSLGPGDVLPLGKNIIHSVTNPTSGFTSAIHVYGGNFFTVDRSEWDPEELKESAYDIEKNMELFTQANLT